MGDLKGTAPGCLGYLFLSKAMRCLETEASYALIATVRTEHYFCAFSDNFGSVKSDVFICALAKKLCKVHFPLGFGNYNSRHQLLYMPKASGINHFITVLSIPC